MKNDSIMLDKKTNNIVIINFCGIINKHQKNDELVTKILLCYNKFE